LWSALEKNKMSDEQLNSSPAAAKARIWAGAKKGSDLYRQIDREQKRRVRAEQRLAAYIPTADEWTDEFAKSPAFEELRKATLQFQNIVAKELGFEIREPRFPLPEPEAEATCRTMWALLSFKKNLIRLVWDPEGEMFGGLFFADVIGSDLIYVVHERGLTKSPTFRDAYFELLRFLDKRYGTNSTDLNSSEGQSASAIKQELAGNYIFVRRPKPEPRPLGPNELTRKQFEEYAALAKNKTCASIAKFKSLTQEEIDQRLAEL
jgi:hypothetical protein